MPCLLSLVQRVEGRAVRTPWIGTGREWPSFPFADDAADANQTGELALLVAVGNFAGRNQDFLAVVICELLFAVQYGCFRFQRRLVIRTYPFRDFAWIEIEGGLADDVLEFAEAEEVPMVRVVRHVSTLCVLDVNELR